MNTYQPLRAIISGGGTGGHIFPAISIANKLKELCPESSILFVGANGRMEMEKVPKAGYEIKGLDICGLRRSISPGAIVANLALPFKVLRARSEAASIIKEFKPDIAIGVGGYASAPLLFAAEKKGIPCLIQEQNSFAGLTNKALGRKADRICVAFEGMEKFFPKDKIVLTGNPIRSIMTPSKKPDDGIKRLLVIGGSLGARTINNAMKAWIASGCPGGDGVQVLWQCGKFYKKEIDDFIGNHQEPLPGIRHTDFIQDIDKEFAMADLVVSRAGASSVSELCAMGKATIFVPSPNVAEDHQTHNAMALVDKGAARIVHDADAPETLLPTAMELIRDEKALKEMEKKISALALGDSAQKIADEIYKIVCK